MRRTRVLMALCAVLMVCGGCTAVTTALRYRALDVHTQLSDTIFLAPIPPAQRTVWLALRFTADHPLALHALPAALVARGYRVVSAPEAAHLHLQVTVRYVGRADRAAAAQFAASGFGGALGGAGVGYLATGTGTGALAGGLGGLAVGTVANALVRPVTYTVVTDVQLSQRQAIARPETHHAALPQGRHTTQTQTRTTTSPWQRYRTRVVATATRVNLAFAAAKPVLEQHLVRSLAGLL